MVRIRLFGEVGASDDRGRPLDLGPAKCQAVLAVLALAPRSAIPVSRIAQAVWGDAPPRTADKTLQSYVTRLRKALGNESIVRAGAAYRLDVPGEAVDVVRFRKHLDAGAVGAALAEWTGTPLAGLDVPGLTSTVEGLHELRLAAIETALGRQVDDDPGAAIGALAELTAEHPFREGLWALLMTALYRLGRQADALAAFQRVRSHLVDELGVEPGRRLRDLEARILDQSPSLGAEQSSPLGRDGTSRGNLPARLDRLIGREPDLEAVASALVTSAIVTLVGAGGIGKTRLSLAAAQGWVGGSGEAWFVELAGLASSADVPRAVAELLGVAEGPGRTTTQAVVAALRPRRALVVLDSCEHLLEGAAAMAMALSEGCPDLHVLATSRERLGVGGEQLLAVPPLDVSGPAAELFAERARAVSRTVDVDAHSAEIIEICKALDGMPLAIELAAARTATLSVPEIVGRLDDRLRLLTRGPRTNADRHRTLRAAIQWSADLLTPELRALFTRLSVFSGGCDLAAVRQVCAEPALDEAQVEDLLEDLVAQSMLVVEPGPGGRRFRLLETLREFAAAELAAAGMADRFARRHARWCMEEVERISHLLLGQAEVEGVERLGALWPNLRVAVHRACRTGDHLLVDALVRPLAAEVTLRRQGEIGEWAERILTVTPSDDVDRVVFWLTWAAHRYLHSGDRQGYERVVGRHGHRDHPLIAYTRAYVYEDSAGLSSVAPAAVAELRRMGEPHLASLVELAGVASGLMATGQLAAFDTFVAPLAARYRADGPPSMLHLTLLGLGYSALFQGRTQDAEDLFDQMSLVRVPDRTFSLNRPVEARAAFRRGDRPHAYAILRDHVDELLETDVMDTARLAALEFVTMMSALDRAHDATPVQRYLETTGGFGELAALAVAADGDSLMTAPAPEATTPPESAGTDAHGALEHIRAVLTSLLTAEGQSLGRYEAVEAT